MSEQKISPCLWFHFKVDETVVFGNGRVVAASRYGDFDWRRPG